MIYVCDRNHLHHPDNWIKLHRTWPSCSGGTSSRFLHVRTRLPEQQVECVAHKDCRCVHQSDSPPQRFSLVGTSNHWVHELQLQSGVVVKTISVSLGRKRGHAPHHFLFLVLYKHAHKGKRGHPSNHSKISNPIAPILLLLIAS